MRFTKDLVRGLITLGLVSVFLLASDGITVESHIARRSSTARVDSLTTSPSVSPLPVPTPDGSEKQPNPIRRFFFWVVDHVTRPFRRRPPMISDPPILYITPSTRLITFCPFAPPCNTPSEVTLSVKGSVTDPDKVWFSWWVTAGRIRGKGREVIWDLTGVAEGTYTASFEFNDGNFTVNNQTTVTIALCSACDKPPPPCPTLSVSCPNGTGVKQPITFVASVTGGDPQMKPTYTWTVSVGKIISGQGTSKITVDTSGLSTTATVSLGGADPSCTGTTASCTIGIAEVGDGTLP
jgi:hypothetical protein